MLQLGFHVVLSDTVLLSLVVVGPEEHAHPEGALLVVTVVDRLVEPWERRYSFRGVDLEDLRHHVSPRKVAESLEDVAPDAIERVLESGNISKFVGGSHTCCDAVTNSGFET